MFEGRRGDLVLQMAPSLCDSGRYFTTLRTLVTTEGCPRPSGTMDPPHCWEGGLTSNAI